MAQKKSRQPRKPKQVAKPETARERYARQEAQARKLGLITDEMLRNGEVG